VLPKKLLDHSGIKETVVFVGQGKTFQMWEPTKFSKFREEARKKAKTLRSDLKWS
jgi:MraZ protein